MIRVLALALATVATASAQLVPRLVEQPLFVSGTGGYHTYRIPAIVRANDGTLLAFCEGRKNSSSDRGDIDIVLRRSQDGGKTWSAMQVVQNEGTQTIGNPAPVVDRATGVVWLLFCRNNDRVFVTSSADHGRTWQARREITAFVKRTSWGWYATGPCHGIQLERGKHRGRLVIPCDHRDGRGVHGSHVVHSDDGGKNWQLSGVLPGDSRVAPNECVAAELSDGRIYLNLRNQHGGSTTRRRAIAYSADGGATFGPVRFDPTLIDPRVQGSALRLRSGRVLFSNPASTSSRTRLTVRSSFDETATWTSGRRVNGGPSAYSDLVDTQASDLGLMYETGVARLYEEITFARFNEEWLDAPPPVRVAVTEPFDYGVISSGSIGGRSNGRGFRSPWNPSARTGLAPQSLATAAFPNRAFATFGLRATGNRVREGAGRDAVRSLAARIDLSRDEDHYVSCLLRRTDRTGTDAFAIQLSHGPNVRAQFGWGSDGFWRAGGSSTTRGSSLMAPATTYFVVLRIAAGATVLDRVSLKVYGPTDRADEAGPSRWTVVSSAYRSNAQLDTLRLDFRGSQSTIDLDELRIGPTWRSVTASGDAVTKGRGCPGRSSLVPTLAAGDIPRLGDGAFSFVLARAPSGSPALLFVSPQLRSAPLLFGNCRFYLDAAVGLAVVGATAADRAGLGRFPLPLPNLSGLLGTGMAFQSVLLDRELLTTNATELRFQ